MHEEKECSAVSAMATEGSWKINAGKLRVRQRLHPHNLHSVTVSFIATVISGAAGSFIAYMISAFKWDCWHTSGVESSHVKRIGLWWNVERQYNISAQLYSSSVQKKRISPTWCHRRDRLGVMEFGNCARSPSFNDHWTLTTYTRRDTIIAA